MLLSQQLGDRLWWLRAPRWGGFDSPTWAESITQGCLYWQQEKWVCFGHESTGLILLSV